MSRELLVIDDEPTVCRALKSFFTEKGFHVATATTIQAALKHIQQVPADVVLLDLRLPDGNGLDLLAKLKARVPGLRVIIMSGLGDRQTIQEAYQRGASTYLTKPFDFLRCFYAAMGIETADLTEVRTEPEALARVPETLASEYQLVPLRMRRGALEVAMADPLDAQRVDELKVLLECDVKAFAAVGGSIGEAIQRRYRADDAAASARLDGAPAGDPAIGKIAEIVRLVNALVEHAHENRATDLHLGIGPEGPWIRERVDGLLRDVPITRQCRELYQSIVTRLKVMAQLDIAERRLPQDGRFWLQAGSAKLDLRLSVLPTLHGENLAIRLLEPSRILPLEQLGMNQEQLRDIGTLLAKPSGLLLVTGPTGSGKSTSLYAFLSMLNTGHVNIVTVEDPIEHELPGLTQLQVQPNAGLTFAAAMRSMLRHDPNIVMVGEIRDQETAVLALRAALSGHLVLSCLHTNDAAGAIIRMVDLGIEPFLLCSTLIGVLSQRLPRLLCAGCRTFTEVDAASLSHVGPGSPVQSGTMRVGQARGCPKCRATGYHGRTGVFELLVVDHHIRSLMLKQTSTAQLRQSAVSRGMQTLWQAGWQKVQAGRISLQELARVLPPDQH